MTIEDIDVGTNVLYGLILDKLRDEGLMSLYDDQELFELRSSVRGYVSSILEAVERARIRPMQAGNTLSSVAFHD